MQKKCKAAEKTDLKQSEYIDKAAMTAAFVRSLKESRLGEVKATCGAICLRGLSAERRSRSHQRVSDRIKRPPKPRKRKASENNWYALKRKRRSSRKEADKRQEIRGIWSGDGRIKRIELL